MADLPFACCEHCGCGTPDGIWETRDGHDDRCFAGCTVIKKPPLGLLPRKLAESLRREQRRAAVRAAIDRYMDSGEIVPEEWLTEYNDLVGRNE